MFALQDGARQLNVKFRVLCLRILTFIHKWKPWKASWATLIELRGTKNNQESLIVPYPRFSAQKHCDLSEVYALNSISYLCGLSLMKYKVCCFPPHHLLPHTALYNM